MEPVAEPTVNHDALLADAMKAVHVEDGAAVSVAVLSDGNSTKQQGVALVEAAARAAVSVFTGGGASTAPGAMTPAAS